MLIKVKFSRSISKLSKVEVKNLYIIKSERGWCIFQFFTRPVEAFRKFTNQTPVMPILQLSALDVQQDGTPTLGMTYICVIIYTSICLFKLLCLFCFFVIAQPTRRVSCSTPLLSCGWIKSLLERAQYMWPRGKYDKLLIPYHPTCDNWRDVCKYIYIYVWCMVAVILFGLPQKQKVKHIFSLLSFHYLV